MTVEDEPVSRALAYLTGSHLRKGALSFTSGASAILPCYLGVVAALQALAAIPAPARTQEVNDAITQALEYLRIHRVYRSSLTGRPLFRHMTQFFLVGDYRSDLLDVLEGIADADPELAREAWVRHAIEDVRSAAPDGRIPLVKNYGGKLVGPGLFEPLGESSRFLTDQWAIIAKKFGLDAEADPAGV